MMRGAKRILNDAQLDEMARLRERGWGIKRIAQHFTDAGCPISPSSINWQCMRVGADAPPRLRGRTPSRLPVYQRNGREVRPYSSDDDRWLLELERSGMHVHLIAEKIGRANSSVRGRLLTLARNQARAEEGSANMMSADPRDPDALAATTAGVSVTRPIGPLGSGRSTSIDRGA